jgi:methyl-accepting chemotaxis protein
VSQKQVFFSLRLKLVAGCTLLFSVIIPSAFYWNYQVASERTIKELREDVKKALVGASQGIDTKEMLALYQEAKQNKSGFSDDPRFNRQLAWLDTVHQINRNIWPYTYVLGKQNEIVYLVDLWAKYDPSKAAKFLETSKNEWAAKSIKQGQIVEREKHYKDRWGEWMTAYIPLKNAEGKIVGGMGIDIDYASVIRMKQEIAQRLFTAFLISYSAFLVCVYITFGFITRPITALTHVAKEIGQGNYQTKLPAHPQRFSLFSDEINTLTNAFDIMVGQVSLREENLKKELIKLKVEIDSVQRDQEVAVIVESDYFQDLLQKAAIQRQKRFKKAEDS